MALRSLLSYAVLVLVPAISLVIAILPYWWVKKHCQPVQWQHLWLALLIGLVGNVGWWWAMVHIPYKVSRILGGVEIESMLLSIVVVTIFYFFLPFVFAKLKGVSFHTKSVLICTLCSLTVGAAEIALLIFLFIYGWGMAVNSFLSRGGIMESSEFIIEKLK